MDCFCWYSFYFLALPNTFIATIPETPLYKVQQYLTYSKEDWQNYENGKKMRQATPADTTMVDVAQSAPESPLDIKMWERAIKNNDYIPDGVLDKVKRYKARDFSKLVMADDKPTDDEAQEAIVRNYQNEVTSLLKQYKATIKIGTCYNAPLQTNDEVARVTAMVSAFNKENGNLGNIQKPLDIIYDFVKYKDDPTLWHLADFSQNIPFDYKLNSDRDVK